MLLKQTISMSVPVIDVGTTKLTSKYQDTHSMLEVNNYTLFQVISCERSFALP